MAKIVKTETQEQALKDITEKLKVVASINPLFVAEDLDNVRIKVTSDNGVNTLVPMPFQYVSAGFKEYRKKLVAEILTKAKANAIVLDDEDLKILGTN